MTKRFRVGLRVLFLLPVVACSNPRAVKVTDGNKDKILETIKNAKGLTVDEVRLLMARQLRTAAAQALGGEKGDSNIVGKTIGELIEEAKTRSRSKGARGGARAPREGSEGQTRSAHDRTQKSAHVYGF